MLYSKKKMAEYMNGYRQQIRQKVFYLLGNKCAKCGDGFGLHVDHIDPRTKEFTIARNWTRSWSEIEEEVKKCQLLCLKCHTEKTRQEHLERNEHGKRWMYMKYGCRCNLCVENYKRIRREERNRYRTSLTGQDALCKSVKV